MFLIYYFMLMSVCHMMMPVHHVCPGVSRDQKNDVGFNRTGVTDIMCLRVGVE